MRETFPREGVENEPNWVERPRKETYKELSLSPLYYGLNHQDWSKLLEEGYLETDDYNGIRAASMMGTPPLFPGQTFKGSVEIGGVYCKVEIEVKKVLQIGRMVSHRDKIKLTLEVTSKEAIGDETHQGK